jgi:hypothetical protein
VGISLQNRLSAPGCTFQPSKVRKFKQRNRANYWKPQGFLENSRIPAEKG